MAQRYPDAGPAAPWHARRKIHIDTHVRRRCQLRRQVQGVERAALLVEDGEVDPSPYIGMHACVRQEVVLREQRGRQDVHRAEARAVHDAHLVRRRGQDELDAEELAEPAADVDLDGRVVADLDGDVEACLLYTSPSPRD